MNCRSVVLCGWWWSVWRSISTFGGDSVFLKLTEYASYPFALKKGIPFETECLDVVRPRTELNAMMSSYAPYDSLDTRVQCLVALLIWFPPMELEFQVKTMESKFHWLILSFAKTKKLKVQTLHR